ncbi:MAG: hypothetical protein HY471_02785 [Candidatus Sungbacteria bacterium]|nr:hypothetical protein [Candidatus Sungbacteria bacterium]
MITIYTDRGAYWFFDYKGDPTAPHALLTGGDHSDGYVDSTPILEDPLLVELLMEEMEARLERRNVLTAAPDWVVSSTMAATTFGYHLALRLSRRFRRVVRSAYAEKNPAHEGPQFSPRRFIFRRSKIAPGAHVLQAEELMTTKGTALDVREAVDRACPGIFWLPDIACGIYRPVSVQAGQIDVIALATQEMQKWPLEECPLCKQGSKAVKPRGILAKFAA